MWATPGMRRKLNRALRIFAPTLPSSVGMSALAAASSEQLLAQTIGDGGNMNGSDVAPETDLATRRPREPTWLHSEDERAADESTQLYGVRQSHVE